MSKATILLVDDEPLILRSLSRLLGLRGFNVLQATDGVEGLAMALDARPDYIVSDVRMPRMDGQDMARKIMQHHDEHGTTCPPIVIVTGFSDLTETDVLELPVRVILSKPARLDEILEALEIPA